MLFSEPRFFLFFAVYAVLHVLIPARYRIWLVIFGGAAFYASWRPDYLWVPLGLSVVAHYGAQWMEQGADNVARKQRLWAVIAALFIPLVIVKYTHFFLADVLQLGFATDAYRWALPLGISFITFTVTAYVVDVYRRRYAREKSLWLMLGYVFFFPHLIAGPILRPNELMPQLKQLRAALDGRVLLGVSLFTLGLVKKLIFADQIAAAVEPVYAGAVGLTAWHYLVAIYGFSVQIYCDFSGYTDMAIGLAYLLRIRLPTNFLRPYAATSLTDFWRRWHITLSFWLRDYLYIPLGGNQRGKARQVINLLITMVLGGLWHGANWTFVIWGALHGLGLSVSHVLSHILGRVIRLPRWLGLLFTFHFVTIAWVFFRAPDVETAMRVLAGPFTADYGDAAATLSKLAFPILLIFVFLATHLFDRHARLRWLSVHGNKIIQWGVIVLFWIVAIAVSQGSSAKFIYFDF
ncbi:MAG: MBOAT family protein [Phyllobacteriaceae bacterium]|nr:MBOAT family protein [Phyllobacteriaceae bacterium]